MRTDTSTGSRPADVFKTFPEFSKLTLADRKKYENLIRDLPPYSHYSFPTLMNWWNSLDSCAVSELNGNLIISYWMPGDEKMTGLSLIGTHQVDETLAFVFDYLISQHESPRLVHVPEFVISHLKHPELFAYQSERKFDEYILDLGKYYPVKHAVGFKRQRIRRFQQATADRDVSVRSLDLGLDSNRRMLLEADKKWIRRGEPINVKLKHADDGHAIAVNEAGMLGIENLCLFVDNEIQAYLLYSKPEDKRYVIYCHFKVGYGYPYVFDYTIYAFAERLLEQDVRYINIDEDLGIPTIRVMKVSLGPHGYLKKYTITPAG